MTKTSWWREPLLHFVALGLLIFAVDHFASPASGDPRMITVDKEIETNLVSLFEEGQGRAPTDRELDRLIHRWLQNEVLYREALALGLDKGDEMIRERLILKMRMVVLNNVVVDPPSEKDLRQWFERNRSRYDLPRRFDFVQFQVADANADDPNLAQDLASGMIDGVVPGRKARKRRRKFHVPVANFHLGPRSWLRIPSRTPRPRAPCLGHLLPETTSPTRSFAPLPSSAPSSSSH
jgi:hypothetical protein